MLTLTDRQTSCPKMLRTLFTAVNKSYHQQQLYEKLIKIARKQNTILVRGASCSAPFKGNPQKLPAQPVPKLDDTVEKYLKSVRPVLCESEFYKSEKLFKQFAEACGCGEQLQQYLLDRAKCTRNWLEQWWLESAYLGYRLPVVVHSSPGQAFPFENFKTREDQIEYAAKLIVGACSYKLLIDNKKLPVEKMGKDCLDMEQYDKIFGTCRIPAVPLDCLQYNAKSNHIVVAFQNHYYKIIVFGDCGELLCINQVKCQLQRILEACPPPGPSIGALSADHRDTWAKTYKCLISDPCNMKSVEEIQKSLFLVCLDNPGEIGCGQNRQSYAGEQFIHGGGGCINGSNRWYDKTIQFVIGSCGVVGICYEHAPAEGQPVAIMVDYIYNFIRKKEGDTIPAGEHYRDPCYLPFKVDTELGKLIATSVKNLDCLASGLDFNCFTFTDYGKNFIKQQKLSPDSYLQMAFQYTFYKLHGEPGVHYESAANRKFIGGRTETIRSLSCESMAFAKGMLDCNKKPAQKIDLLRTAINAHKKYSVEAVNGYGVDRHLLGLKLAAKALNCPEPAIFQDPSFIRSTHFRISSSQVATKCDGFMCYGPVQIDGYGVCYNPRDDTMNFAISSFQACTETSATNFRQCLEAVLCEMKELLTTCNAKL